MKLEIPSHAPLVAGEDETVRVKGSRVTLDVLVRQFQQGATAEQIVEDFPSLTLREIYGAIYFYLDNTAEVEDYLRRQAEAVAETREFVAQRMDSSALRARIRARQNELVSR